MKKYYVYLFIMFYRYNLKRWPDSSPEMSAVFGLSMICNFWYLSLLGLFHLMLSGPEQASDTENTPYLLIGGCAILIYVINLAILLRGSNYKNIIAQYESQYLKESWKPIVVCILSLVVVLVIGSMAKVRQ